MFLLRKINSLFWRLEKTINVWLRIDTYEFKNEKIIKTNGPWRRTTEIPIEELQQWQIIPEMTFDIVILTTNSGRRIVWMDRYGDLVGVLRNNFRQLEHKPK